MHRTRTLIVDDDVRFRDRLRQFLATEPSIEIVAEAADGQEALRKAREHMPDLVLMDIKLPGMNGLAATHQLKSEIPGIEVIILTLYELEEYREAAAGYGIQAYVVKRAMMDELLPAIQSASAKVNQEER